MVSGFILNQDRLLSMQTECTIHSGVPVLSERTWYQDPLHKIIHRHSSQNEPFLLIVTTTTMLRERERDGKREQERGESRRGEGMR